MACSCNHNASASVQFITAQDPSAVELAGSDSTLHAMVKNFSIEKSYHVNVIGDKGKRATRTVNNVLNIGGCDFVPLSWRNRAIAALFVEGEAADKQGGKGITLKKSLLNKIRDARNKAVDELITNYLRAEDPMSADEPIILSELTRTKRYHEANVPQILTLNMPAFTTDNGEPVDVFALKIVSSPKASAVIYMELTADSMKWLSSMSNCSVDDGAESGSDGESDSDKDRLDLLRTYVPENFTLVSNPYKKRVLFLRTQINKKVRQRSISYTSNTSEHELKQLFERAVEDLQKKITDESAPPAGQTTSSSSKS